MIDTINVTTDVGTILWTPKEQRAYRERKQREEEQALAEAKLKYRRNSKPKFCFITAEEIERDIRPATMARLVYLATFLGYDGCLKYNQSRRMKKSDLQAVLQLSISESYNFWSEVGDTFVFKDSDGILHMNKDFSCRGNLERGARYQQVYIDSVQRLYRATPSIKHKYLGYVFQMLPYVNVEYNLLCSNPFEDDLDLIEPITVSEFCKVIGYAKENKARLMKIYSNIVFDVGGKPEQFCAFVTRGTDISEARIFVNPHILYRGEKDVEAQILGKLCDFSTD